MKAVKQGKEVVLTERGKPIAVIKPLEPKEGQEAVIWRLEAEGDTTTGFETRTYAKANLEAGPGEG